jgi:hypothetical protein
MEIYLIEAAAVKGLTAINFTIIVTSPFACLRRRVSTRLCISIVCCILITAVATSAFFRHRLY